MARPVRSWQASSCVFFKAQSRAIWIQNGKFTQRLRNQQTRRLLSHSSLTGSLRWTLVEAEDLVDLAWP
mgnify:CR=1 FL=1